jgi:hypothetical protein
MERWGLSSSPFFTYNITSSTMDTNPRHRLSIDIDREMHEKLQQHVPWGVMKHLINAMLKDFLHLCEKHDPNIIIGAILSDSITLRDFLNKYAGEEEDGKR